MTKKTTIASAIVLGFALVATAVTLQSKAVERPVVAPVAVVAPVPAYPNASEVFTLVNNERIKAGLPALVDNPKLDASAAAKCADETQNNYHEHVSPSGVSWYTFVRAEYPRYTLAGENLSWGYPSSATAVAGLMGSPLHKANILNPTFTDVGYAVCNDNWVVQHFLGF